MSLPLDSIGITQVLAGFMHANEILEAGKWLEEQDTTSTVAVPQQMPTSPLENNRQSNDWQDFFLCAGRGCAEDDQSARPELRNARICEELCPRGQNGPRVSGSPLVRTHDSVL